MATGLSVPNARIKEGVEQVGYYVYQYIQPRDHQQRTLDNRIVSVEDTLNHKISQSGQREHGLCDNCPANEDRHRQSYDRENWNCRVSQRVLQSNLCCTETFCA